MAFRPQGWMFAVLLLSCGDVEGDEAGECSDGADNDQNGYFDCQDNGCWASPDCDGVDPGTDTDTGTQSGELDARLKPLTGANIIYSLAYKFAIPVFGVDDCTLNYAGTADTFESGADTRISFEGTWKITDTDCPPELKGSLWVGDGPAMQSFVFSADVDTLTEWYAHKEPGAHQEGADDAFYITEMDGSIDVTSSAPTAHFTLKEDVVEIHGQLEHTVDITFSK